METSAGKLRGWDYLTIFKAIMNAFKTNVDIEGLGSLKRLFKEETNGNLEINNVTKLKSHWMSSVAEWS